MNRGSTITTVEHAGVERTSGPPPSAGQTAPRHPRGIRAGTHASPVQTRVAGSVGGTARPVRAEAPPAALAAATSSDRIWTLDAARLVASIGIVWCHSVPVGAPAGMYGVYGTPFFTLVAVFFLLRGTRNHPDRGFLGYAASRATRLYLPFLAWSAAYFLVRNLKSVLFGEELLALRPDHFLRGTSMQLWFLPFVFLACVAVFPLARWLTRRPPNRPAALACAVACAAGAVAFALFPKPPFLDWGRNWYFVERSWEVVPAVGLGVALFIAVARASPKLTCPVWLGLLGLVLSVGCLVSFHFLGFSLLGKNLAGLGLMLFALCPLPGAFIKRLASAAPYSIGIYLIHPLFTVAAMELYTRAAGPLTLPASAAICLFGFAAAGLTAAGLYRGKYTRWLVV